MKSIQWKLVGALGVVEISTLVMALVLLFGAGRLDRNARQTREANDDVRELLDFSLLSHRYMNAVGRSLGQRTLAASHERRTAAAAFQSRIEHFGSDTEPRWEGLNWRELGRISTDLGLELARADALREQGKFSEAERAFAHAYTTVFDLQMLPWFATAIERLRTQAEMQEASTVADAVQLKSLAILLGLLSGLLASGALAGLSLAVLRPVQALVTAAEALGRGDLTHRIGRQSSTEFTRVSERLNSMADIIAKTQSELLDRNAQLEKAYRLQSDFVSVVSHELRSPLHSILGYLEFIEEGEPTLAERSKKNLRQMSMGARRLLALINDSGFFEARGQADGGASRHLRPGGTGSQRPRRCSRFRPRKAHRASSGPPLAGGPGRLR